MSYLARTARFNQLLHAYRIHKQVNGLVVQAQHVHNRAYIGSREIVGFGFNGGYDYYDSVDTPFPSIRFREENEEIKQLREKERGDWNKLTLDEKKKRNICFFLKKSYININIFL